MKRCLTIFVVALGVLTCSVNLRADDKNQKAAARELLQAMEVESQLQSNINTVLEAMLKVNPQLGQFKGKIHRFYTKYMGWEGMEDEMVKMYAKTFTEQELKDITAFYKSPAGKRLAKQTPEIVRLSTEIGVKKVQENEAELIRMIQE
jgi:hypothetical protein